MISRLLFWAVPIPRGNNPDWLKISEFVLEKGTTLVKSTTPGSWYWTFVQSSIKVMTLKSLIYRMCCGFTNYSWGLAHALRLLVACTLMHEWRPQRRLVLYLMSYAHLARRVSGPLQRLQLLIPEVLGSNPTSNLYLVFLLYLQVTILRIIINVRCSLIKKSEWSSGNTQYSQSGVHAFKPSWVQESVFFLNYKI